MANYGIIQCFFWQFFHISGSKFNIPIFPHFFHSLQPQINFLLASAEGRAAANRDKDQGRDDDRNGRSPRDSRSNSRRRSAERDRSASPKGGDGNVLYIGNLSRRIEESEVREAFEKCGKVSAVELVKDPYTNECRGFAFVTFETSDDATEGLRLDNTELDGRKIRVEKSKRQRGHKKTPGEYLGHYKSRGSRNRRSPSPRYRRRSPRSGGRRSSRERHSDRRDRDRDSRRDRHRSGSRDRYRRSSRDRSDSRSRRRR